MFKNSTRRTSELNVQFNSAAVSCSVILTEVVLVILAVIGGLIFFGEDKLIAITVWVTFGIFIVLIPILSSGKFLKNNFKKVMVKNPTQDENVIVNFVFDENGVTISSERFEERLSTMTLNYVALPRVVEHKQNLYIYFSFVQAVILTASGMTEGTFEDLKEFLRNKIDAKKYKVKK